VKLALIVNPAAGGGRAGRALPEVEQTLVRLGLEYHVELTRDLEHSRALAGAAANAGEVAVAFGGDGLVGAVAGALRGGNGILGVLPGGRGNDLARTVGISLKPPAACQVLATGVVQALDLGEVNGRTFIGIASCGFDSEANRIANQARIVRGNLVYAYGALRALTSWKPATFTVELDRGEPCEVIGYSVAAANARAFGGGIFLAPDASLQDGRLDVVTIGHVPRLEYARRLPMGFTGAHVRLPNVDVLRCASVRISASRPFTMYADGDPIAELPVTVNALPAAVNTILPAVARQDLA
jgi:YegS/Rv2252/BmrU family lipid kinase